MTTKDLEEMVAPYVDGELDQDQYALMEEALRNDALLRESVARYRMLRAQIAEAYAPAAEGAIPAYLRELIEGNNDDTLISVGRTSSQTMNPWLIPVACIALLIGGVIGNQVMPSQTTSPIQIATDGHYSDKIIDDALTNLASGDKKGDVKIVSSFRNAEGKICRIFDIGNDQVMHNLACLDAQAGWSITAMHPAPPAGSYLPAGENDDDFADQLGNFVKMNTEAEKAWLDR